MTENNKRNWSKPIWFGLGTISGTLAVLAVGALLLPGAVDARRGGSSWGGDAEGGWSRGGGGYGMEMLRKADADDDRKISLDEFKAARGERFAEIDTDGDGAISKDETLNHMIERLKERIDRSYQTRDQDGNGMIDEVEFAERGLMQFGRLDRNDDGYISRKDMHGRGGRDGGRVGEHRHGGKGDGSMREMPNPGEAGDR